MCRLLTSLTTKAENRFNTLLNFSRRARGVELWAALRSLGREGLADLIERTCCYARRMAEDLQSVGYEILNEVVINQVLVSFGSPEKTKAVISRVQEESICWCGGTEWQGSHEDQHLLLG